MHQSHAITRKSASNLAMAFILLPSARRDGMSALYAFCRQVDDAGDDESRPIDQRRQLLAEWRADVRRACSGETAQFPVNQELRPVIQQYKLPFELFDELIRGVEMDLDIKRYETFSALEQYCYRVASVVGLLSIEIFGYRDPACRDYAIFLGKALQFTNILRDVQTDARLGRIYLPMEELRRFRVTEDEILRGAYSDRFRALAASVAKQARHFYQRARETLPVEDRRSMAAAELMGSVYWRLLEKLEAQQFNVFGSRLTRVGKGRKVLLVLRTWYRAVSGGAAPNYGTP
ncbi:MAG: presqualene diphosphate synthase HpnD [Verrucomicrobia bacterium]|nr:presqualene diphosphate synthase HpnD [Verrucomicrobiota bacterium]